MLVYIYIFPLGACGQSHCSPARKPHGSLSSWQVVLSGKLHFSTWLIGPKCLLILISLPGRTRSSAWSGSGALSSECLYYWWLDPALFDPIFSISPKIKKEKKKNFKTSYTHLDLLVAGLSSELARKKNCYSLAWKPSQCHCGRCPPELPKGIREGQVAGKNTRVTFFPKDITETLNGRGFPGRGQFCVCLFYGKIRITCTAYQKYRFLQTHWISHMVGD